MEDSKEFNLIKLLSPSRVPFNVNDYFIFLFPGIMLIAAGIIFYQIIFKVPYGTQSWKIFDFTTQNADWPRYAFIAPFAIVGIYLCGYLVELLSIAIFETLLIEYIIGHPYHRLFNKHTMLSRHEKYRQLFFKSIVVLIILGIGTAITDLKFRDLLSLCLFSAAVAVWILKFVFDYMVYQLPNTRTQQWRKLRSTLARPCWRILIRPLLISLSKPLDYFGVILASLFRINKPFPSEFQNQFEELFRKRFGTYFKKELGPIFHYALQVCLRERNPDNCRRVEHLRLTYAFTRNIATVFLIMFIVGAIAKRLVLPGILVNLMIDYNIEISRYYPVNIWLNVTSMLALAFGYRFYRLYYDYFSECVLMAFFALKRPQETREKLTLPFL